ncbi:MAG: alpha/beta hydrolase [Streptococcaceae bacterium]|jgi:fermentation-respiration switch protein FrsA (DUF1100 family)|nr:alpha/beta hydrolase [Streptococcaceae bacterium]
MAFSLNSKLSEETFLKIKGKIILLSIIGVLVVALLAAGFYFFHVAQVREKKDFITDGALKKENPVFQDRQDFINAKKSKWQIENDGLKLVAYYLPAEKATKKTVIVAHGFSCTKERMGEYAWMFHKLGYNVLTPDNRAHGESEGKLIGFGWNDRMDYVKWIQKTLSENGNDQEIALFGLSMGAATVMMTSGEKLPSQVKTIIEDCGYDSVWNELVFQAKDMYNLPAFPILYEVSLISKIRAGFSYKEASSVRQLQKNHLPMLFIHGSEDKFVPTEMVYKNYAASKGPKELLIVKGAKHAKSIETDKALYTKTVKAFLLNYFK